MQLNYCASMILRDHRVLRKGAWHVGGSIEEELLPEYVEPEIQNDGNLQTDAYSVSFFVSVGLTRFRHSIDE
jgi:hypothetical protein